MKNVTIVVVTRERFQLAPQSLDCVLRSTPADVPVVYVDAGTPPAVAERLLPPATGRRVEMLRAPAGLSPNQARNRSLPRAAEKFVVFLDNDTFMRPGWLEPLVRAADETGATAVVPVYGVGPLSAPERAEVHTAGGLCRIEETAGRRTFHEHHGRAGRRMSDVAGLGRQTTELAEFHCVLVRRDFFDRQGGLDEGLLSILDHSDFSLRVRAAGGEIVLEPASMVTYRSPPPLHRDDVPYFLLRWSPEWNRASARRFAEKHRLAADDPAMGHAVRTFDDRRRRVWGHAWQLLAPARRSVRNWCFDRLTEVFGLPGAE